MRSLAWPRGPMARVLMALGLAVGSGLGTFAVAHAATASPSASPAPSTSGSPANPASPASPSTTTHNCPNM
jgi:hypothetical protein